MNTKIHPAVAVGIVIILAVIVGGGIMLAGQYGNEIVQKPCTMEAKLCPDGSAVGRTGPNCEFEACPEYITSDECKSAGGEISDTCADDADKFGKISDIKDNIYCCKKVAIVGDDRDEHGCIGSAGYSWCEEKRRCLRAWEEVCDSAVDSPDNCQISQEIVKISDDISKWRAVESEFGISMKIPDSWVEFSPYDGSEFIPKEFSIDEFHILGNKNGDVQMQVLDYTFDNASNIRGNSWISWYMEFLTNDDKIKLPCFVLKCGEAICTKMINNYNNGSSAYIINLKNGDGIKVLLFSKMDETTKSILASIKIE